MNGADRVDPGRNGTSLARGVALTVRFLLEIALLAGAALLAWRVAPAGWNGLAAAVAVLAVAVAWGLFLSPKARFDIGGAGRLLLELLLFGGIATGLLTTGLGVSAIVGFLIWGLDRIALRLLP